ncbi:MAG: anaerobic sulfatase-maturation protein [Bacteroidales bacterium]|nr:anaerobic sulfatase-maturation protein [Bacteroidales bacterium]
MNAPDTNSPFSSPLYLMAKPAGAVCNLACEYCYYLEKKDLYSRRERPYMSDATLERYIRTYIEAQTTPSVEFVWHGGEPTLRSLDFFRRAMELQKRYAGGRAIANCLQTNGTLLTPEWCRFLHDNGWLVGISIDGPAEFHDEYRRTAAGKPTSASVMKGIQLLRQYGVEWNAMAVVNDYNADHPLEFYNFFKNIGCRYIQFTPIVERLKPDGHLASPLDAGGEVTPMSVAPEQWGSFLCAIFDEWVRKDVGQTFVQIFDSTLANWVGVSPGVCTLDTNCGHAAVMEHNGDVYSCDHFVFPQYRLGNIHSDTVIEMMGSERQLKFGAAKSATLPRQCRECRWLFACHGECPKNRFALTADGEPGLNYLCSGYRRFFSHVAPYMDYMRTELAAHRSPANVMRMVGEIEEKGKRAVEQEQE